MEHSDDLDLDSFGSALNTFARLIARRISAASEPLANSSLEGELHRELMQEKHPDCNSEDTCLPPSDVLGDADG